MYYNYDDLQHHYDPSSERCGLGYECEQLEKRRKEEEAKATSTTMSDSQKIKAIKHIVENTPFTSIESIGEALDSIVRIVYGIEKKNPLFDRKGL